MRRRAGSESGPSQDPGPPREDSVVPRGGKQPSVVPVLRRSLTAFGENQLTTLGGALSYFAALSIVPGLIVLFVVLGLGGGGLSRSVTHQIVTSVPGPSAGFVRTLVEQARAHRVANGAMAVVGVVIALWSASGYVNSFRHASNMIYGIGEGRPTWKTVPLRIGLTLAVVGALVAGATIVVVSGSVAEVVGNALGAGHAAVVAWGILKWPVLVLLVSVLLALLYWAAPNARQGRIRWVSRGSVIATLLWLITSGLFALYVSISSSYVRTYGALSGVVVFLVWLWLTNLAVLFGAQVNAETEHSRAIASGLPADVRPFVQPRDDRRLSDQDRESVRLAGLAMALTDERSMGPHDPPGPGRDATG